MAFAPRALLLCLLSLGLSRLHAELAEMQFVDIPPCIRVYSDVGDSPRERQANAREMAKYITETQGFFMRVYSLTPKDFVDYATKRHSERNPWDPIIHVRFWRRYDDFLGDFQGRYQTKTIPGAFFGIMRPKDEYGEFLGPWMREIGVPAEGQPREQVLRHLYHEMGHLFMKTYMFHNIEVPSWIEEGTAELFQYREGNGTNPAAARREREAWMVEVVNTSDKELGSSIPWPEFTQVRNLDNLDFTFQDPLRSSLQYLQAWSVCEFVLATPERRRAYTKFLADLKVRGEQILREEGQRLGGNPSQQAIEAYFKRANDRIYQDQYDLFRKNFGADLLAVEGRWRDWVRNEFEKKTKRDASLHYYRGDWQLSYRARFARDAAVKEAALGKAEEAFAAAIAGAPDRPEGYVGMGRLALTRGNAEAANAHFAEAASRGTDNFEALLYGGIALVRGGRPAEAVAGLSRAVEQRPDHFDSNLYLGWALAATGGEAGTAIRHLGVAQDIRPGERSWPALLASVVEFRRGDLRAARIQLIRAEAGGGDPRPLLFLAVCQHANGEPDDALATLRRVTGPGQRAAQAMTQAIGEGKALLLGFGPDGQPGVVGYTIPAEQPAETAPAE